MKKTNKFTAVLAAVAMLSALSASTAAISANAAEPSAAAITSQARAIVRVCHEEHGSRPERRRETAKSGAAEEFFGTVRKILGIG